MTAAAHLAEFTAELRYDAVPDDVLAAARHHVLDALGVMVVTERRDTGTQGLRVARRLGGFEQATAIGAPRKVAAPSAALANGMLAHALDFDDSHSGSITHPSAVIVPAVLAAAELTDATEAECLTAGVAGYELIARIGAVAGRRLMDRGFHSTPLAGAFAAAAVCGRLLGVSRPALVSALGLVGSQAAGILEFLADGTDAKQLHAGWAAHAGLHAALLADEGLTGPASVLEGRFGLFRSHVDADVSTQEVIAGLGSRWATTEVTYKAYPACHLTHTSIDALLSSMGDARLAADDIVEIHCAIPEFYVSKVLEPRESKLRPRTPYEAKFSLPFCLASTAVHGRPSLASFDAPALADRDVLALAERVTYEVAEFAEFPAHYPGAVTIRCRDGRTLHREERETRRLTASELREKFLENAGDRLGREGAERTAARVLELGATDRPIAELMAAFRYEGAS